MNDLILKLYMRAQSLRDALNNEEGQDLIEYALVVSLIAFAAVTTMSTLANNINAAFSSIGSKVASNT